MPKSGGRKPVESHKTAAWSNAERSSRLSRTAHPSEFQTDNAKQYADENEK